MQPSQSPKPVAPIRSADTYSPRHSAVTTETKGVISRCQVGPSQAVIVVPDRVDTARLAATYEVVYVMSRQPHYFFDLDAIRVPHRSQIHKPYAVRRPAEGWRGPNSDTATGLDALKAAGEVGHPLGKNPGDVWTIATSSYRGAHYAVFPVALAEKAIAAGCPEYRCTACRLPWQRSLLRRLGHTAVRKALAATCSCGAPREPGVVLDPFMGSGTTALAAENLDRDWLGIELNPDFAAMARERIDSQRQKRSNEKETAA
jgi:site-specific DNA-methyltransferase (adenine-specific)